MKLAENQRKSSCFDSRSIAREKESNGRTRHETKKKDATENTRSGEYIPRYSHGRVQSMFLCTEERGGRTKRERERERERERKRAPTGRTKSVKVSCTITTTTIIRK
jgi:hypothetical protein